MGLLFELDARTIASRVAAQLALPPPTEHIDDGMEAHVFATTDHRWVVRVGSGTNEALLMDEDFASGVTKVLAMRFVEEGLPEYLDGSSEIIVTWKERINEYVLGFIRKSLRPKRADRIAHALLGLYHYQPDRLKILKSWKGTRGLAEAMEAGMPTTDLDLRSNLGVTRDGRIVAFDL